MFKKIKLKRVCAKLHKAWGTSSKNPSLNELVVIAPLLFLLNIKKKSFIFSNRYVCADAILISCAHTIELFIKTSRRSANSLARSVYDLERKAATAIQTVFGIKGNDLQMMVKNRIDFFGDLLNDNDGDLAPLFEEAALLFAHDLHHNKYVEYSKKSPLILMDYSKQQIIEAETWAYFKNAFNTIGETIIKYCSQLK